MKPKRTLVSRNVLLLARATLLLGVAVGGGCYGSDGDSEPGHLCSLVGCVPTVYLQFDPPQENTGRYVIELLVDGVNAFDGDCTLDLGVPVPVETHGEVAIGGFTDAEFSDGCSRLGPFFDTEGLLAGLHYDPPYEIDTAADPDAGESVYLDLPRRLEFSMSDGSRGVAEGSYDLDFEPVEVNGPGCGTCPKAKVEVAVDW